MRKWLLILLAMLPALSEAATITYSRTDFPSGRPPERIMAPRASDNDTFEEVLSSSNSLQTTPGTLVPCEIVGINRCAVVSYDTCTRYTADQAPIKTGAGVVTRILVETLAATTDDFILYDNTAASGTVLYQLTNMPATSSIGPINVPFGGVFGTGLSLDVTLTAGSSVTVCYL